MDQKDLMKMKKSELIEMFMRFDKSTAFYEQEQEIKELQKENEKLKDDLIDSEVLVSELNRKIDDLENSVDELEETVDLEFLAKSLERLFFEVENKQDLDMTLDDVRTEYTNLAYYLMGGNGKKSEGFSLIPDYIYTLL